MVEAACPSTASIDLAVKTVMHAAVRTRVCWRAELAGTPKIVARFELRPTHHLNDVHHLDHAHCRDPDRVARLFAVEVTQLTSSAAQAWPRWADPSVVWRSITSEPVTPL